MSTSDEKTQQQRIHREPAGGTARATEPMTSTRPADSLHSMSSATQGNPQPVDDITDDCTDDITAEAPGVYFFPDVTVTEAEVHKLLASDVPEDRAKVVAHLLSYAEYDEIWTWVDRDTVRDLFDRLTLPERLRAAWARNLGWVAKVD